MSKRSRMVNPPKVLEDVVGNAGAVTPFGAMMPKRSSLVEETAEVLRRGIKDGQWHDYLPGERVMSEWWQVSRPTLRAAMMKLQQEGWIDIAHGRRSKVLKSYPDRTAQARLEVCILTPEPLELMPPFVMLWLDELRRQLATEGHCLHVQVGKSAYANERPDRALSSMVESAKTAVWVLYQSTEAMQRWFQRQREIQQQSSQKEIIKCVVVGSLFHGLELPAVDKDYRATCRHAVGMMFAKGHLHLALLIHKVRLGGDVESVRGFEEGVSALSEKGVKGMVAYHDASPVQVERVVLRLLRMPASTRPTALLVARSAQALLVLTILLREGVKVPQEMALICRDDDAFLDHVWPRMTRYAVTPKGFAKRLFKLVMRSAENQHPSASNVPAELVLPDFVARESL